MKIGVISDTHIPLQFGKIPNRVLGLLKDMDMIIHAGDLITIGVLDSLRSICDNVKAVCGNMDSDRVKKQLSPKEIINIGKYRIGVTHGSGSPATIIKNVNKVFEKDNVDIIIFGHSHSPLNEKREGVIYFNPGSLTDKIFAPFNSYGIIEINDEIKTKIIKI